MLTREEINSQTKLLLGEYHKAEQRLVGLAKAGKVYREDVLKYGYSPAAATAMELIPYVTDRKAQELMLGVATDVAKIKRFLAHKE